MRTLFFIILTGVVSNVVGAVMLIKQGGWLPTLVAIISLMFMMVISSITLIIFGEQGSKKTNKGGQTQ